MVVLFVNGTLMKGLKLHKNLEGAEFLGTFRTMPLYRLHTIDDIHPGMYKVNSGGVCVTGELYRMSKEIYKSVQENEPAHLYTGEVFLEDGTITNGILYPENLAVNYPDISEYGCWRKYMSHINGGE